MLLRLREIGETKLDCPRKFIAGISMRITADRGKHDVVTDGGKLMEVFEPGRLVDLGRADGMRSILHNPIHTWRRLPPDAMLRRKPGDLEKNHDP